MTTEIHISNVKIAEDSELRSMSARLGSHTITTPVKSTITKDFYKETRFPKEIFKLNEIFFRFNEDSLDRFNKDLNYSMKINKKAEKSRKYLRDCDSLCLTEFRNKGEVPRYPNKDEIKSLINIAYSFSDITPIPSVPKMTRYISVDNFEDFLNYLSKCYEEIMIRNKKRILGYIPTVSQFFVDDIIDFYIDRGINGFYIDFDGTMVTSHLTMINAIKKRLAKRGYEEKNFLYYTNVSYGKAINEQNVLSARDVLAFGHGLDCLGGIHTGPRRNKGFYEWLKKHKDVVGNAIRLFNKQNYGYYRINSPDIKLEEIFPSDSLYSIEELQNVKMSRMERLTSIINLQQQSIESINLENLVDENPDKTIDYFDNKENILKDDIRLLIKK